MIEAVTRAYARNADLYVEVTNGGDAESRERIAGWAAPLRGRALDAGCGPGHWSALLHGLGLEVDAVDATAAFVEHARATYPEVAFRVGDLRDVTGTYAGVLSWFSTIHLPPSELPGALEALAAMTGESLLLGWFTGTSVAAFDHRVVTAWTWPVPVMLDALRAVGLRPGEVVEAVTPNGRPTASVTAHP